jgi:hypothetical protein
MTLLTLGGMTPEVVRERQPLSNDPRNHLEDSELAQVTQVRSGWLANSAEVPGQLQHHEPQGSLATSARGIVNN